MAALNGVFRGTITNVSDPMGSRRVQVRVPAVYAGMDSWATTALPPGARQTDTFYRVGDNVVVAFEGGDANAPVVLGKLG